MDVQGLIEQVDQGIVQDFVVAAQRLLDATLIAYPPAATTDAPAPRDYNTAQLGRGAPLGGWLSASELEHAAQRMSEAITTEKWASGALIAMQLLGKIGGAQ
jgi:hypothetical protein